MSNDTELLHASVIKRIWKKCKEEDMDIVAFAWRIQREAERAATLSAPTAVEPDERQPLTDEQIKGIVSEASKGAWTRKDGTTSTRIVRAVEAAHGVTARASKGTK